MSKELSDTLTESSAVKDSTTKTTEQNKNKEQTIGRFAPSPTGPLHFGSLIAATASYLSAKNTNKTNTASKNQWLLRIEDVDTQRTQKGATSSIIKTLESFGFKWDGDIIYQSQRDSVYKDALNSITESIYPCSCTRKSLMSSTGSFSYIYPGHCRNELTNPDAENLSLRIRTNDELISFKDQCQVKTFSQNINKEVGDFILKRSDGLWAYQLAVVVDDYLQGITEVVRGADLFDNTPRQIFLQRKLGYSQPEYCHFPVVVDEDGKKFSKQNASPEVTDSEKRATLISILDFLGQNPLKIDNFSSLDDLWAWSFENWDTQNIPKVMSIPFSSLNSSN